MSPLKQTNYFCKHNDLHKQNKRGTRILKQTEYLKLFKGVKDEKAIGEASPDYLSDPTSAKLIFDAVPDARIIIMLRDPIERAFSHYLMQTITGGEKRTFHDVITQSLEKRKNDTSEYIKSLDPSLYASQVKRYLDFFGSKNVMICISEEFFNNPREIVKEVLEFLEVDAEPPKNLRIYNKYGQPHSKIASKIIQSNRLSRLSVKLTPQFLRWRLRRILLKDKVKPSLSKVDREILQDFFLNDVKDLQNLLKRRIPWNWINQN